MLSDLSVLFFLVERISPGIVDADDFPAHSDPADKCSWSRRNWRLPLDFQRGWYEAIASREAVDSLFQSEDHGLFCTAEPGGSIYDAVQDRLQLVFGSTDGAKNVRQCRLLLPRLA